MSVTPSPIGGFAAQFFDNNGVILSGGKIYTYAAGTTTPQAVYTSASGATPHANPIILDSAGRVPGGEIWLTDGLVYKFVIETATAILLGTYDNITGINSNFVNYTVQEEVITATAGQTVFNLTTINYTPATNSLTVYIDGVNQYVGDSYIETDSDTVTFTSGVHVGGEVKFTTAIQTTTGSVDASIVTYDPPFTGGVITNVEAKLAQYVSVKDFGAVGNGVANDAAAINTALTYAATLTNGADVILPAGTYACGSTTINVPAKVRLVLSGAKITSSATNAVVVTVGNDGATGGIIGSGHASSLIDHSGTGSGVVADGIASQADLHLSNFWVRGTSAGTSALNLRRFNRATTSGLKLTGYTAGSAILSQGANSITHYAPEISTVLYGVNNQTSSTGGIFTSNAVVVVGGQIINVTGYGWLESETGGAGRNLGNRAIGVTFENNGVNGSATTGDVFNQNCDSLTIESCYFETYAGNVPTNCITIGDASNGPKGMRIVGNVFQTSTTNTINDVNGQTVFVENNVHNGTGTNFLLHGTLARGLFLGPDRVNTTNYFGGSDSGLESVIVGGAGTFLNQQSPTTRGYGFNTLSGYNQDLVVRTRGGGTNAVTFQNQGGSGVAGVADNGTFSTNGAYQVSGTQVVGAQGAAVANATGSGDVVAQLNALLSRLRTHGLIAT